MTVEPGSSTALIIGGDSTIGRHLVRSFQQKGACVWQTTRRCQRVSDRVLYLDLATDPRLWQWPAGTIDTAIFCAAITSMQRCETEPDATWSINVTNTVALASELVATGCFVIFLSTNAVFDGSKALVAINEPTNPKTEYGRQKAAAEQQLLGLSDGIAVIRLGKVITPNLGILNSWIDDLKAGRTIHPFTDLLFSPVSMEAVINLLTWIATHRIGGIFHLSGPEDITYAEAAYQLANILGVSEVLVQPMRSKGRYRLTHWPCHSTLATDPVHQRLGPLGWDALNAVYRQHIPRYPS